jgi:TonB family protein
VPLSSKVTPGFLRATEDSHKISRKTGARVRQEIMTKTWRECEGQVVDQEFNLRHYLGESYHCAVFLTDFGEQKAAIKLFSVDPENAEHQLSLWELTAGLSHPHLMRLLQMGRCQVADTELLYFVMEYAEETLSQILPDRPLTVAELHEAVPHILDVLGYLHANGFVHGHIRPANIMAVGNQLKISSDRLSRVGEFIATRVKLSDYDAPESLSTGMSPAADIWSLGITLVESLTQHRPHREGTDLIVPDTLPLPFSDIASHCLVLDPRCRYTVAEVKERLQPSSVVQPEPAISEKIVPKRRQKTGKAGYILPIAAAFMIVMILAGPKLRKLRPETAPSPTSVSEQPAPRAREGVSARGIVVDQVIPEVPQSARDTIRGTVRVVIRVTVDPTGNVAGIRFDSPGPSRYFSELASQAAQRWKFRSPTVDGQNVSSEWILTFKFERAATTVVPIEVNP